MIVFDLKCGKDHVFEAWFKDSPSFDKQVAGGEVSCPMCGTTKVEKALMAPNVNTSGDDKNSMMSSAPEHVRKYVEAMREVRREIEDKCDYVGDQFPEEARKIHYGETESRGIYGEATDEEAAELSEEGVEVQKIPWAPVEDA